MPQGIVNTSYQVGSALGLAVMTALATSQGADQLADPAALTEGYSAAFLGAAGVAAAGALPRRASCCALQDSAYHGTGRKRPRAHDRLTCPPARAARGVRQQLRQESARAWVA